MYLRWCSWARCFACTCIAPFPPMRSRHCRDGRGPSPAPSTAGICQVCCQEHVHGCADGKRVLFFLSSPSASSSSSSKYDIFLTTINDGNSRTVADGFLHYWFILSQSDPTTVSSSHSSCACTDMTLVLIAHVLTTDCALIIAGPRADVAAGRPRRCDHLSWHILRYYKYEQFMVNVII